MPKKQPPKPSPKPIHIVCSLCDEPWELHEAKDGEVSTLECIRLLKLKRTRIDIQPYRPYVWPQYPYMQPYWATSTGNVTTTAKVPSLHNACAADG